MSGQYGDKVINKDPKRWLEQGGAEYAGCKMSECPSDYLLAVADLYDWQADMDEKKRQDLRVEVGEERGEGTADRAAEAEGRGARPRLGPPNAQTAPGGPSTSQAAQPRQASGKAAQGAPRTTTTSPTQTTKSRSDVHRRGRTPTETPPAESGVRVVGEALRGPQGLAVARCDSPPGAAPVGASSSGPGTEIVRIEDDVLMATIESMEAIG